MRHIIGILILCLSTLSSLACQKEDAPSGTSSTASSKTDNATHAPAHAVPGSHEDWCGEHQVPESMCTQCNASLIAAFKATGDWCAEHGLPESQCRLCNPDLKITRPPKGPPQGQGQR
jgi:hypothetical protein